MRRLLGIVILLLAFPVASFAQTDGGVEPPPPETPVQAPQPSIEDPSTAPATAPEPTSTAIAEPATAPAPRPAPSGSAASPEPIAPTSSATSAGEDVWMEGVSSSDMEIPEDEPFVDAPQSGIRDFLTELFPFISTLAAVLAFLGIRETLTRRKERVTHVCARCGRKDEATSQACAACEGSGKVDEEHEGAVECPECRGEGEVPCETCDGEGVKDGKPCTACGGSGSKKDEDGEPLACALCRGEGEVSGAVARQVACAECGGTGRAR